MTKPLWRIRERLEGELKLLKRRKLETMAIVATMLKIGIGKGGFAQTISPIMKTALVVEEGKHSPSMVDHVFRKLLEYNPPILKRVEENSPYNEGKDSQLTKAALDIIAHDIKIYKELERYNLLKESERILTQIVDKRLKEFYVF